MLARIISIATVALMAVASSATAQAVSPAARSKNRIINTWVAPYATDASYTALTQKYHGVGPQTALTRLGLQFWLPTADGKGVQRAQGDTSDATIKKFVKWAHHYGIKVLLCLYNNDGNWDWNLAANAFGPNKKKFVAALVKEMNALGLDGIDIDFEGYDADTPNLNSYETAYVNFIKSLSAQVHASKKILTLDSLSYVWNAPNTDWWNSLFPYVDGLTSMGYEQLGRDATSWQAYSWQVQAAGRNVAKLTIGLPSNFDSWLGDTAQAQVDWFIHGWVGISIWDAQFPATAWHTPGIWKDLTKIKGE